MNNQSNARVKAIPSPNGAAIALQKKQVYTASPLIQPAADTDQIVKAWHSYLELKSRLLDDNDYQAIRGKKYIKKSGWRKIQTAFAISDELIKEERKEYKNNVFVYELTVKVSSQNGRFAYGVGSCASNERSFAHVEHDVRSTAHTRAKNRAISDLVGFGEVSAEEMNGTDNSRESADSMGSSAPVYTATDEVAEDESSEDPATMKQIHFLRKLLIDRCGGENEQFRSIYAKQTVGLSKAVASRTISALLMGQSI